VPDALRFLGSLAPGGIGEVMERNHAAAVEARRTLCAALGIAPPCPDAMIGSMASVPLPDGPDVSLQEALFERFRIEVPIFPWPAPPARMVRVSTPPYVEQGDVEELAQALRALL
jgi:isopenicillin-N epimerase